MTEVTNHALRVASVGEECLFTGWRTIWLWLKYKDEDPADLGQQYSLQ